MKKIILFNLIFGFGISNAVASDWNALITVINDSIRLAPGETQERAEELERLYQEETASSLKLRSERKTIRTKLLAQEELFAGELESTVFARMREALILRNAKSIQNDLGQSITFSDMAELDKIHLTKVDGIAYGQTRSVNPLEGDASAFLKTWFGYLDHFKKLEYVDVKVLTVQPGFDSRSSGSYIVTARFDIRGLSTGGKRRADKMDATIGFDRNTKRVKLVALELTDVLTTRLDRAPAFQRLAKNAGFDDGKSHLRLEALRRGGYGFAIEDTNNNGELEAFVGNYGASSLWTSKNGIFTQVSAPEIEKITLAKAAAFADFDNDGWKDLFITRFSADKLVGDLILFRNDKGTFKEVKNAFPSQLIRDYAMPAAIADYNNDGLLDIYVGFPGARDFSAGPTMMNKLTVHGLFLNKGNFSFTDQTKLIENYAGVPIMPHGALASDFDNDGNIDLIVMDDQSNLSPIYRNNGKGRFVAHNNKMHVFNYGYGMGIASGDFNQDGMPDYLLSNATFNSIKRFENAMGDRSSTNREVSNQGLRLFMNSMDGRFIEATNIAGLSDPGEAAAGVTVIDYDNDGLQDIYLVNGMWSGSSRDDKIDSMFAIGATNRIIHQDHFQDGLGDSSARGTRSLYMRALQDGKTRDNKTYSFAGYQRNRLFKNLGNGQFLEVGYLEGADSMADGYMSAVADINRDGKADLVLRNCDNGAPDYKYAPVEIFQNYHKNAASVWITLKGKQSNSSGVGAKIIATVAGKTLFREMSANNSAMQGEIVAHVGLGSAKSISKLLIKWPSGITNVYKNIQPGRHSFQEKEESIASF